MQWSCIREGTAIKVFEGQSYSGSYKLLKHPYCEICAHTDIETVSCVDHYDLDGFQRIYAMGKFCRTDNHTLAYHIYALKLYPIFAEPLAKGLEIVVKEIYPELLESTMIVPIPQHPDKLSIRKYNQSLELARALSNNLSLPIVEPLLKIQNIDLRGKGKEERRIIAEQSFIIDNKISDKVWGQKVLLIDDVVTSCSTVSKCARLLNEARAKTINVLAAGRKGYDDV